MFIRIFALSLLNLIIFLFMYVYIRIKNILISNTFL